jgi:hypothetical protein
VVRSTATASETLVKSILFTHMFVVCCVLDEGWFNTRTQGGEEVLMEAEVHAQVAAPSSSSEDRPEHDYSPDTVAFTGDLSVYCLCRETVARLSNPIDLAESAMLYHQRNARKGPSGQEVEPQAPRQATRTAAEVLSPTRSDADNSRAGVSYANPILDLSGGVEDGTICENCGWRVAVTEGEAAGYGICQVCWDADAEDVGVHSANAVRHHDSSFHADAYHQLV